MTRYHIVFVPKNRRKVIYGKLRRDLGQILRKLCEYKQVGVIEGTACGDHIHRQVLVNTAEDRYDTDLVKDPFRGASSIIKKEDKE